MTRTASDSTIAIIGLGYVGLPLAVEFGKKFRTIGFDIKQTPVHELDELNAGHDRTREVDPAELRAVGRGASAPEQGAVVGRRVRLAGVANELPG